MADHGFDDCKLTRRQILLAGGLAAGTFRMPDWALGQGEEGVEVDTTRVKMCADIEFDNDDVMEALRAEMTEATEPLDDVEGGLADIQSMEAPLTGLLDEDDPDDRQRIGLFQEKKWKDGATLTVSFLDRDNTVEDHVRELTKQWTEATGIKFQFVNNRGQIRISRRRSGHWSNLGTDALAVSSAATMNLQLGSNERDEEYSRVILHEFGHALGAVHEHSSPSGEGVPWKKEAVYEYYFRTQGWNRAKVDKQVLFRYSTSKVRASQFDVSSIMLYPIDRQLLTKEVPGLSGLVRNTKLSPTDKNFMGQMYGITARSDAGQPGSEQKSEPKKESRAPEQTAELKVDGEWVGGNIGYHNAADMYRFSITSDNAGFVTILTRGSTRLVATLFGPDSQDKELLADSNPVLDSEKRVLEVRDLRNIRLRTELKQPGTYHLRVRHYSPKGTGEYRIIVIRNKKQQDL